MSAPGKTSLIDLSSLPLWLAVFLCAAVSTHLLRDAHFPVGWNYLALFLLAGISSSVGRGIYRWVAAAWGGALLMLMVGTLRHGGYTGTPPGLLASQYLPAALTGALLGEWLRYQFNRWRGLSFSPVPSRHTLVAMAALLIILPLLAFLYAADRALAGMDVKAIIMFAPGNTPFLFPSLITAVLCAYWVRLPEAKASATDRYVALLVMVLAILLILMALLVKFIYGVVEVM